MEFRAVTNEFEKQLFVDAWEKAFIRNFDPEVAKWIFNDRNNMYAVFDEDKIAAGYCLLNNKVIYNGEVADGALCNNVFVRPEYAGLNLFIKMGRYSLQKAGEQGKKIILGIPNKNAVPGHRRVGWTFLNQINFLEKNRTSTSSVLCNDNIKVITMENYDSYKEEIERFSIEISSQRSFSVIKDKSYFKWRYLERPSVNYKIFAYVENNTILGYIVYKAYEAMNRLHIIDVEAKDEKVFDALIELSNSFEGDFNLVNVWGSSIYYDNFIKNGFNVSNESNNLIAYRPQVSGTVELGDKVNIVLSDNEVF